MILKEKDQKTERVTNKLNILIVIHGYPPYYMAGSEVYTRNKCIELSKTHNITIFSRMEDEFRKAYEIEDSSEKGIRILRVNKPWRDYTFRSKYYDRRIAEIFKNYMLEVRPNIVHIDHLSHLTLLIVDIIKKYQIPIVFTLHDYWMMCLRGQLIKEDLTLCDGPEIEKCSECNKKYFLSMEQARKEVKLWLNVLAKINESIDIFIAPSRFLRKKYIEFGILEQKIFYKDYGFDTELFKDIQKSPSEKIRFGFLGRVIPVKGIATLIDTFNEIDHTKAELKIWGKIPSSYQYLKNRCRNSTIHFKGGFNYENIASVLSDIDVLIVPSIWYENSPLVIHEAFLANIPVIASNLGGMAELIEHKKNGLLFEVGNVRDLREKVNEFIKEPDLIERFTQEKTPVRSIQQDVREIVEIYNKLINKED